jgi:hypothetical protein
MGWTDYFKSPGKAVTDHLSSVSPDFVNNLVSGSPLPNSYDIKGELANTEAMTGDAYANALEQYKKIQTTPAPSGDVAAKTAAAPDSVEAQQLATPNAVTAQQIATPDTLGGQEAADLRAQRLQQAQDAADSPSAAAAQLKAGMGAISQQQMGQANMARGADRASSRRDAMLATGTQGMQAANTSAAMAATEQSQKQQALTGALAGVQASDVNAAQAQTQIGAANQGADITAQTTTNAQALQAGAANQGAALTASQTNAANKLNAGQFGVTSDLQAQQATAQNNLQGWQAQTGASNQAIQTAIGAAGTQAQAQGVAATAGAKENEASMQNKGAIASGLGGIVGGISKLSDERAKSDVKPLSTSDKATAHLQNAFGLSDERVKLDISTAAGNGPMFDDFAERSRGMKPRDAESLLSSYENLASSPTMQPTTHNREWADFRAGNRYADYDTMMANYAALKRSQGDAGAGDATLSDEQAKQDVDQMGASDLADFAERVPLATYRYKPGIPGGDDGQDYHAGTLAQSLEATGPLGQLMVHERGDGLKEVEYGPLGLAVGKGALAEAQEAKAIAQAALAKAGRKAGR